MPDLSDLPALRDASAALTAPFTLSELLAKTLDLAMQLAGAETGALALVEKDGALTVSEARNIATDESKSRVEAARGHVGGQPGVDTIALSGGGSDKMLAASLWARGRQAGYLCLFRSGESADFTKQEALRVEVFANHAASAIDAAIAKGEFVSTVTHELRLPMTSIKGYTDLLRGGMVGAVTDQQKGLLETVRNNVDWMNSLISDLGDISKLDTGRLKVEVDLVDVASAVQQAVNGLRLQVDAKGQTLTAKIPALPKVRADASRLTQINSCLLANACRYTPANGSITVSAETTDKTIRISVADTGIGIADADRAKLFTPFFRSEDAAVREHKGWGLSLHLAKRLAELFGGEMGVETQLGKGSTFWLTLPIADK
ncbi:MAG: HAMP domain-containing sensor histidine kinase [Chloroflexota bacterium]